MRRAPARGGCGTSCGTGLKYVRDEKDILTLTALALASTFLGVPLLTFLPVFARNVFHADVGQYSQMMAWSGIGAIAGALVVAWLGRFRHMGRTALIDSAGVGHPDRRLCHHAALSGSATCCCSSRAPA